MKKLFLIQEYDHDHHEVIGLYEGESDNLPQHPVMAYCEYLYGKSLAKKIVSGKVQPLSIKGQDKMTFDNWMASLGFTKKEYVDIEYKEISILSLTSP